MSNQINVGSLVADLQVDDKATPALAKARKAMEQIAGELRQLEADLKSQAISMQAYSSRVAQLQSAQAQLASAMQAAFSRASSAGNALDVMNAGLARSDSFTKTAARGLMQVGYVVDDLQYSFMAAVNNVGPLLMALGAGPGIAGTAQIAAVASQQLYNQWDKVLAVFGDTSGIDKARESVKGMEQSIADLTYTIDTTGKFTWSKLNPLNQDTKEGDVEKLRRDRDQLNMMRQAEDAAKAMQKAPTDEEKKATARFQGLVSQFEQKGGPGGIEGLARSMGDRDLAAKGTDRFLSDSQKKTLARLESDTKNPARNTKALQDQIKGFREVARKNAEDAARKRLAEGSLTGTGREQIRQELANNGTPEEQELARLMMGGQTKKEKEENDKRAEEARKRRKQLDQEQEREFRKNNLELARQLMPSVEDAAKQAQDLIDLGTGDRDAERQKLASSLEARGMSAADAGIAARDLMAQQAARDPADRAREREQNLAAARSEQEQAQREREQRAQNAIARGESAIPGLKDRVEESIASAAMGGGTMADVTERIRRELLASGAASTNEEATDAAAKLAGEGRKSLAERVRQAALGGGENSQSQTMAASDLARTAQAGVSSNDTQRKMDRIVELLGQAVQNGANVLNVRID